MAEMTETTQTYQLTGYNPTPSTATAMIRSFDKPERMKRALKGLVTFWAAAIGSIFIPVAHFLLVPSFALYGAYTFFERLGAQQVAVAVEGTCPDCGKPQKLETGGRWHVPRNVACRYCQRALKIS
ncbi:MAG: hypothetical protein DMD62_03510 [Gemmatimonadetes bacterium]|nr:MAG: hypothetical protein DMD62_03510 [Gemmatimonadota bacterium]